jgi:hypothetical protein
MAILTCMQLDHLLLELVDRVADPIFGQGIEAVLYKFPISSDLLI